MHDNHDVAPDLVSDAVTPDHVAVPKAGSAFPRAVRLTKPAQFERAIRRPDIRMQSGPLRVSAVFNRMQSARLGLVVGKRAVPRSPDRNRIKRIIRDAFRKRRTALPCVDIVIRVVGPAAPAKLRQCLDVLFGRLEHAAVTPAPEDVGSSETG